MKTYIIFASLLISVCITANTYSQSSYILHFGPSLPLSDFALEDLDNEDAGGAAMGVSVGLQFIYRVTEFGLGIYGGIDFNYNGLTKDVKNDIEEYYENMGIINADIIFYKYLNLPISAGLNYTYQANDKVGVFTNAGLVVNSLKITDMELKTHRQAVSAKMDVANSIGFKIGGGMIINQKVSISIDYLGLGTHDIKGEIRTTDTSEDIEGEMKVDLLNLTLGFIL
jgi:hypothetical protein